MDIIEQLKPEVQYLLEEGEGVHDWDHTLRVYNLAIHIGEIEGADLETLGISALLHDIGRPEEARQDHKICHAEIGAVMAEGILAGYGLGQEKIDAIKYCIRSHRYSKKASNIGGQKSEAKEKDDMPKTKEAKILWDADKLDNIGAIGIARAFNYSGTYGARTHNPEVHHEDVIPHSREDTAYQYYKIKLEKIKDKLFTSEARYIAKERDIFMKEFFNRLNDECVGKK